MTEEYRRIFSSLPPARRGEKYREILAIEIPKIPEEKRPELMAAASAAYLQELPSFEEAMMLDEDGGRRSDGFFTLLELSGLLAPCGD